MTEEKKGGVFLTRVECLTHGDEEGIRIDGKLKCRRCLKEAREMQEAREAAGQAEKPKDGETEKPKTEEEKKKDAFVRKFMRDMGKKYNLTSKHGKDFGSSIEELTEDLMDSLFPSIRR